MPSAECAAGHDERGAPAYEVGECPGDGGGKGHAQVPEDAVDADRLAQAAHVLDYHGGADGMIDRRKQPDEHQTAGHPHLSLGEAEEDRRGADADEEQAHHAAPAPAVAEPPGRQGADTQGGEGVHGKGQPLSVSAGEFVAHGQHRRQVE